MPCCSQVCFVCVHAFIVTFVSSKMWWGFEGTGNALIRTHWGMGLLWYICLRHKHPQLYLQISPFEKAKVQHHSHCFLPIQIQSGVAFKGYQYWNQGNIQLGSFHRSTSLESCAQPKCKSLESTTKSLLFCLQHNNMPHSSSCQSSKHLRMSLTSLSNTGRKHWPPDAGRQGPVDIIIQNLNLVLLSTTHLSFLFFVIHIMHLGPPQAGMKATISFLVYHADPGPSPSSIFSM